MSELTFWNKLVLLVATVNAAAYLLLPMTEGSFLYIGVKASCCLLLAILAYRSMPAGRLQKFLVLALLCSSLGDIFLAIRSADYFVQGLGSFLIAHLLYISIFVRARHREAPLNTVKSLLSGLVIIFAIGMLWLLWPHLGALKAPVSIYITVISAMAISALYSSFNGPLVIIGALSFLISDATIAINKFLEPLDFASPLIWITYFLAQALLTLAIIKGPQTKNADPRPA